MTGYLFTSGNFLQAFKIGSILAFFKPSLLFKINICFLTRTQTVGLNSYKIVLGAYDYYCQTLTETAIQRFILEIM